MGIIIILNLKNKKPNKFKNGDFGLELGIWDWDLIPNPQSHSIFKYNNII